MFVFDSVALAIVFAGLDYLWGNWYASNTIYEAVNE
jgi:hypothetical protein